MSRLAPALALLPLGAAFALGVAWWWLAAAGAVWLASAAARGTARLALLALAPLALACGLATDDVRALLAAEAVVLLSLAPLVAAHGAPARWPRALLILLAAHVVPLALWLLPPGRVALGSDLGVGALVLALAAGGLAGVAATARGG